MNRDEPEPEPERGGETQTGPHSRFLGALDAHKHITDKETRTTQTLRLMPWYYLFFVTTGFMLVIALGEITGHVHAAAVAKSLVTRWVAGSLLGGTFTAYGAMRLRRKLQEKPKGRSLQPRKRARGNSTCTRQVQHPPRDRPHAVGLPSGRDGNRQRHERPHGKKPTPRHGDRHQHPQQGGGQSHG